MYVLAAGGIENARLLLLSGSVHPCGLGDTRDVVGRDFMEHPRLRLGHVAPGKTNPGLRHFDPSTLNRSGEGVLPAVAEPRRSHGLVLSKRIREEPEIFGSCSWLEPVTRQGFGDGVRALRDVTFWLRKGRKPDHPVRDLSCEVSHPFDAASAVGHRLSSKSGPTGHYGFNSIFEQEPLCDSRVTLDDRRDTFGLRRVQLHWRVGELCERSLRKTRALLVEHLRAMGQDCEFEPFFAPATAPSVLSDHMGTTRMSASPRKTVGDAVRMRDRRQLGHVFAAGRKHRRSGQVGVAPAVDPAIRIDDTVARELSPPVAADMQLSH